MTSEIPEGAPAPTGQERTVWFILFGALSASILMYGVVAAVLTSGAERPAPAPTVHELLRPLFYGISLVLLGLATVLPRLLAGGAGSASRNDPIQRSPRPTSRAFLTGSIVALALSEAAAVLGLVLCLLGEPITEFVLFAAAALGFNLLYVLPQGLRYWGTAERR